MRCMKVKLNVSQLSEILKTEGNLHVIGDGRFAAACTPSIPSHEIANVGNKVHRTIGVADPAAERDVPGHR